MNPPLPQLPVRGAPAVARRAFTLLEVLLATAIFAIIIIAANTVFFSALHLQRTASRAVDEAAPLNQAFSLMRHDLQSALPPGTGLIGDFRSGVISVMGGSSQGAGLEFYTSTGTLSDDLPWGDVQKVAYLLRNGGNNGKTLVRSVTRNLLATAGEEPEEQELLGQVDSMEVLCATGTQWRNAWDTSAGDTGLPSAVRVRLTLLSADGGAGSQGNQPRELLVPLTVQSRDPNTNSTSLTTQ